MPLLEFTHPKSLNLNHHVHNLNSAPNPPSLPEFLVTLVEIKESRTQTPERCRMFGFMSTFIFHLDIAPTFVITLGEGASFFCVYSAKCCKAPSSVHIHYKNSDHLW